MYNPISTYRIQFNKDFTFRKFLDYLDYFSTLGAGTIYAGPVFAAAPGSMHGYDVVDPHIFNPEIGTKKEFDEIVRRLKNMNIGWLQDIVPNHMAINHLNSWLMDVLENGRYSEYASFFDIDFDHPDFNEKLILPFLGSSDEEAAENGEIRLICKNDKIYFGYFDYIFPVNMKILTDILDSDLSPHLKLLSAKIKRGELQDGQLQSVTEAFNSDIAKLKDLLAEQHYKLTHWETTNLHLNYRRFFNISSLISLHMEKDEVFDTYHSFISGLIRENKIQGLRLDHIDGLMDPAKYIDKLRVLTGDETYIVAEKILSENEDLPGNWPIQGTTGYDFLVAVNNLLTHTIHYPKLRKFYINLVGNNAEEIIYQKKKLILTGSMQGDLNNLCRMFLEADFLGDDQEISFEILKEAIGEFLLACPRYKLYSDFFPLSGEDRKLVQSVVSSAIARSPDLTRPLVLLQDIFLDQTNIDKDKKEKALNFFLRCMQYTGPLMAKGIEDTAMYTYNCFIAHNEVGDRIDSPGINKDEFHDIMMKRQRLIPLSLNATSTHDTKRSEDVRSRLNVISEIPELWIKKVNLWIKFNREFKTRINEKYAPDVNEEYFIYQTLAGVFPFDQVIDEDLIKRIEDYLVKAFREAKINTTWNEPDEKYEAAVIDFLHKILASESEFLKSFLPLQIIISDYGIINSLVQVTLKTTCPGIPDFYQGSELCDFSMVDPDNRRPVDFGKPFTILKSLIKRSHEDPGDLMYELYQKKENGQMKLWLTHILLKERELNPDLFAYGQYVPLKVSGKLKEHVLAYARTHKNTWFIVIIPLYMAWLNENDDKIEWSDTTVELPALAPGAWSAVSNTENFYSDGRLKVSDILKLPVPAILKGTNEESKRKAGILLHITSLPGKYGTGDVGPEAYDFIDFLKKSGHTYWQILPINPVTGGSNYSPYSTYSAFAGNELLIDPEWLVRHRLVSDKNLVPFRSARSRKTEFSKAEEFRSKLLDEAFSTFKENAMPYLTSKFKIFCEKENYWLDDFVLYMILKKGFKEKSWNKWPKKIRDREREEINLIKKAHDYELEKEKFSQFLFFSQWQELREYSWKNGISIIGDMAFYVSYDSVDVWQNPDVFKLDRNKKMLGTGGAPPDYYSKTGQFWNMPVYNWDKIKSDDYSWWRKRVARNMEWYDVVRFDHFRGFSGFWEVKAGEKTAVNGQWTDGPGEDFFLRLKKDFHNMPFIAEDLGDIDNKVYRLRDNFGLPGMKVLQFAFNNAREKSIHLPHNYISNCIVYTGTHDNNTTRGWYEKELNSYFKKRMEEYLNKKVSGETIQEEFIRLAYGSVAFIAIIPLQDILGSDHTERFNNPGGSKDSWKWKLESMERALAKSDYLIGLVKTYWRC